MVDYPIPPFPMAPDVFRSLWCEIADRPGNGTFRPADIADTLHAGNAGAPRYAIEAIEQAARHVLDYVIAEGAETGNPQVWKVGDDLYTLTPPAESPR